MIDSRKVRVLWEEGEWTGREPPASALSLPWQAPSLDTLLNAITSHNSVSVVDELLKVLSQAGKGRRQPRERDGGNGGEVGGRVPGIKSAGETPSGGRRLKPPHHHFPDPTPFLFSQAPRNGPSSRNVSSLFSLPVPANHWPRAPRAWGPVTGGPRG